MCQLSPNQWFKLRSCNQLPVQSITTKPSLRCNLPLIWSNSLLKRSLIASWVNSVNSWRSQFVSKLQRANFAVLAESFCTRCATATRMILQNSHKAVVLMVLQHQEFFLLGYLLFSVVWQHAGLEIVLSESDENEYPDGNEPLKIENALAVIKDDA